MPLPAEQSFRCSRVLQICHVSGVEPFQPTNVGNVQRVPGVFAEREEVVVDAHRSYPPAPRDFPAVQRELAAGAIPLSAVLSHEAL